jgi:hypothetical protein
MASVDLYWLPLGAGGWVVRWNGRCYERLVASCTHRRPRPLFHSALEVRTDAGRWVLEMAPVWNLHEPERGAVVVGPVGARWLGRSRLFRYEVRCWRGGRIPDVAEAVDGPVRLSTYTAQAECVLQLAREVPALTWGRDELGAGEMWNSNSLVSWLLASSGHDLTDVVPPLGGRAPGWDAGLVLAARSAATRHVGPLDSRSVRGERRAVARG